MQIMPEICHICSTSDVMTDIELDCIGQF